MTGVDAPLIAYSESGKPPSLLERGPGPAAAVGRHGANEYFKGAVWLPQLRGGTPSCCCVALREGWTLGPTAVGEVWALVGAAAGAGAKGNFISYLSAASPCVFVRAFAPEAAHGPFPIHLTVEFPSGGPTRVAAAPAAASAANVAPTNSYSAGGGGARAVGRLRQSVDTALLALSTGQPVDVPSVVSALAEGIPPPGPSLELGLQEIESRASALRRIRQSSMRLLADVAPAACPRLRTACDALYRAHLRTHDVLLGRSSSSPGASSDPPARDPLSLSQQRRLQRASALVDSCLETAAHESARARRERSPEPSTVRAGGAHERARRARSDTDGTTADSGGSDANNHPHAHAHSNGNGSANGRHRDDSGGGGVSPAGSGSPGSSPSVVVRREVEELRGVSGANVSEAVDALKRVVRRVATKQMEEPKPKKRRDGSGRLENPMAALDATERMLAVLVYTVDQALGFVTTWQQRHPAAWREAGGAAAAAPLYDIVDNFVCHVQQHYLDSIITQDADLVSLRRQYQRRVGKLCTRVREVISG